MCGDTKETPAEEGQKRGELLVAFQLIPKRTRAEIVRPTVEQVNERLRPIYKLVWLDILVWGVRDLHGGSNPYVRFDVVGSDGELASHKSKRSNRPSGRNANFLERIVTSIELPEDAIFTPMLNIRVYDNMYGGLQTELAGSVSVNLVSKLPWHESYKPPQTEQFETPVVMDKSKLKLLERKMKSANKGEGGEDDDKLAVDDAGADEAKDSDEEEQKGETGPLDPGLGAFDFFSAKNASQMWQLPEDAMSKAPKKEAEGGMLTDWWGASEAQFKEGSGTNALTNDLPDPRELGIDIPDSWASREWIQDRDFWLAQGGSELEDYLKTSPFENYMLKKGCVKGNGKTTVRNVGKFKGLISITETKRSEPHIPLERVAEYVARVYIWKVRRMHPEPTLLPVHL